MQSEPAQLARRLVAGGDIEETHQHAAQEICKASLLAMLVDLSELPGGWPIRTGATTLMPTCARRLTALAASWNSLALPTAKAVKAKAQHDKKVEAQRQRRAGRG